MPDTESPMHFSQRLRYVLEAAGFFLLIGLFWLFRVDAASAIGGFIAKVFLYRTPLTNRARANLIAAYPEKSDREIEQILKDMWDNLGRTFAEYPHLEKFSIHGANPRIIVENVALSDAAVANGKGVLFVSGHFANWELMPFAAQQRGYDGGEVYRPVNNPYVSRWIVNQRIKCGPKEQITKGAQGTRRIFTLLRRGKSIFLLVDQKTNEGISVPFFGREAMTTPAPAALALKLGAVVLPASIERVNGANFRMTIHPPIKFEQTSDNAQDIRALTLRINQVMEVCVRANPAQWLWLHRRWPREKDRPTGRRSVAGDQVLGGAGSRVEQDGSSLI